ncbi:TPA: glycosyltransferase, partial [Enterobacter cloacae]|nr:glycosyltransferase [Enterobacter cloacae]
MQNSAPLLSVVVAVYNGEAFLDQFFTCLVDQRIDSMEVIIVNDGSTDRSMQIVENWREKLPQMQVIEQQNQGVSIARNTGLAVATGQYLSFPDIDDVFKPGMYQHLLDMAVTQRLDVA